MPPPPDELAGGSARDPVRAPGWLRVAAVVAVGCLAGWVLVAQHPSTHAPGSPAPPAAAARPEPITLAPGPQRADVLGSQPGLLGVRAVCVRRDQDRAVWLGVDLVNGRLARTTLLSVTAVASGAASARDALLPARRTCDRRPRTADSLVMLPGGVLPVRVPLQLGDGCGTAPVSLRVDVSFLGPGEQPDVQRLTLHPDPREVADACGSSR